MSDNFEYPEFYNFPPFFTLQPVLETREKQLALWRQLILRYHTQHKIKTLVLHDCPLWKNERMNRQLTPAQVTQVVEDFCQAGHGEWQDDTHTTCRILWRKPDELAADVYQWATFQGHVGGGVCTFYELHSGEDVHGESFQGVDEELLRRALKILEDQGKCTVFQGDTSSEDGIKFM